MMDMLERSTNDALGIKRSFWRFLWIFAYGKLVRVSFGDCPFNARTLFYLVCACRGLPKIDAPDEISIDPNDLRIDVYRSRWQGRSRSDSAVRVT